MEPRRFRTVRTLRLGSFHIGSAMSDVLVSSVLNRVLISHFGFMAWPVALLLSLRYLLSPLSLWAGARSDISAAAAVRPHAIHLGRTRADDDRPGVPIGISSSRGSAAAQGRAMAWLALLLSLRYLIAGALGRRAQRLTAAAPTGWAGGTDDLRASVPLPGWLLLMVRGHSAGAGTPLRQSSRAWRSRSWRRC